MATHRDHRRSTLLDRGFRVSRRFLLAVVAAAVLGFTGETVVLHQGVVPALIATVIATLILAVAFYQPGKARTGPASDGIRDGLATPSPSVASDE